MAWHSLTHGEHFECKQVGGELSVLQTFWAQKIFPGAVGAQVASSNWVLTGMGWGVQRGGGGCQASQVSAPHGGRAQKGLAGKGCMALDVAGAHLQGGCSAGSV